MRILSVTAHPDDMEILCGGTLLKYKKQGHDIVVAHLCTGDKGHFVIPPDELVQIRKKEGENAAGLLGAEIYHGEFPDLELLVDETSIKVVINLIRKYKPDLILTHSIEDYLCDHRNTSQAVIDASYTATLPNYKSEFPAHNVITPIFFMDTIAGINFQPTEYVDVSDETEMKEKMLLCHESQYKWLKEHDNIDYVEMMKTLSKLRGLQCGVRFAEGFKQYQAWGRLSTKRLLP